MTKLVAISLWILLQLSIAKLCWVSRLVMDIGINNCRQNFYESAVGALK